jgi:hypothetical protein
MPSRGTPIRSIVVISLIVSLLFSSFSSTTARAVKAEGQKGNHTMVAEPAAYLNRLAAATYENLIFMVEPRTGLPYDHFDAVLFDIAPQFGVARKHIDKATGASLRATYCKSTACKRSGAHGLRLVYQMPADKYGSYNINSHRFNGSKATYLEAWVRGAQGGERFEFVLWSYCNQGFPDRPESAEITATTAWQRVRIPLLDFVSSKVNLSSLCRLSIGFNDALSPAGTVYLDQIAFVDATGNRIRLPLDETTNVSNVGLYIADVIGALELGLETPTSAKTKLNKTLTSLERLEKSHGFPHTHNHVVSLKTAMFANKDDRCRQDLTGLPTKEPSLFSTVDLGNLAAGLILLRQRIPELSARAGALVDAMKWDWLYDDNPEGKVGLPYGCRAWDGTPSEWWNYDWLAADSRLAHAIGIGTGGMPAASWKNLSRIREPVRCYSLRHFEPGWDGGGLFMAFLPGIFLDEIGSPLGTSAHRFALDQICEAQKIGAPAWGWSATTMPDETYCGYGCERLEVLVPHASILAADYLTPTVLMQNLQALESLGTRPKIVLGGQQLDFGFRASVNWEDGQVTHDYLFLDQSMAFLSLVNKRENGIIRQYFCQDLIALRIKARIPDYTNSCQ